MACYSSFAHLFGNLMAAVDFETTGKIAGYHEIIQVAVVPIDSDCKPITSIRPFYEMVAPDYPERAEKQATSVHGINVYQLAECAPDKGRVADMLSEWWESLDLYHNRRLVPLAHNWPFESSFFDAWIGLEEKERLFHGHARDAMLLAASINDRFAMRGEHVPFHRLGLESISRQLGIVNEKAHDAYADCICEAEVYRQMLKMDF